MGCGCEDDPLFFPTNLFQEDAVYAQNAADPGDGRIDPEGEEGAKGKWRTVVGWTGTEVYTSHILASVAVRTERSSDQRPKKKKNDECGGERCCCSSPHTFTHSHSQICALRLSRFLFSFISSLLICSHSTFFVRFCCNRQSNTATILLSPLSSFIELTNIPTTPY